MKEFQVFNQMCGICQWIRGNSFEDALYRAALDIAYRYGYIIRIR